MPPDRRNPDTADPALRGVLLSRRSLTATALLGAAAGLAGCADLLPRPAVSTAAARAPREALPLDDAVDSMVGQAFAGLDRAPAGGARARTVVIDPLIDRASAYETTATRAIAARLEAGVRDRYRGVEVRPFTTAALAEAGEPPLMVLGAVTPVTGPGSTTNAPGGSDTYRLWAVLADPASGLVRVRPMVWITGATVDPTPSKFAHECPCWTPDPNAAAYLRTCSTPAGQAMDPAYLRALQPQAATAQAIAAYEDQRYADSLQLFRTAAATPGGAELRVLNGIYLTSWALGRRREAEAAFGQLVDYGLAQDRLAVKLLFRPGGTEFVRDPGVSAPYRMWLRQIARRADASRACLRITGHASVTGTAEANDRVSRARAERVRGRLVAVRPALAARTRAEGRGEREPIVGTGTDDMRDALDRRVEFATLPCANLTAGTAAAPRT